MSYSKLCYFFNCIFVFGFLLSFRYLDKFYTASGLTSILKELSDDIVPAEGEEIYNPFTPVVSPTDDTPAHIDKMFMQTSSGYRPVEHYSYYGKHSFLRSGGMSGRIGGHTANTDGGGDTNNGCAGGGGGGAGGSGGRSNSIAGSGMLRDGISGGAGYGMRTSGSYGDTRCLLDGEYYR